MSKKLLASCLTIGLIFSVIPSTAEAALIRGRRYGRGSITPTNDTTVYGIEDSNDSPNQGLFRNAISSNYISFESDLLFATPPVNLFHGEAFYGSYSADRVNLVSILNRETRVVTYSFQPDRGSVTYVRLDAPNPPYPVRGDDIYGVLEEERITNVSLSATIPAGGNPDDYVNNINFILDNDILVNPWLSVETESGFSVSLTYPSYECLDSESDCIETEEFTVELSEEIVPESNLLSGLAGILMLGFFKFFTNKNSQVYYDQIKKGTA